MPKTRFEYVLAALLLASAILALVGIVVFWRATTFEGYIGALLMLALALVSFQGARDLKQLARERSSPQEPVSGPTLEGEAAEAGPNC